MLVLGIHSMTHDIGVALLQDGRILGVIEEERLSGRKHHPGIEVDGSTPTAAIAALLAQHGRTLADIEVFAHAGQAGAPWMKMDLIHRLYREFAESLDPGLQRSRFFGHHECHAAAAFYASGFSSSAVLTIDGAGCDHLSTTMWRADEGGMELVDEYPSSQSIGFFYTNAAETVGLGSYGIGEGKLMALAALGRPLPALDGLIRQQHGRYRIDPRTTARFAEYALDAPELPVSADFAASVQAQVVAAVAALAQQALARAGSSRLCIAGGVALNCRMNGELLHTPGLDEFYVPPMPGDSGLCVGAAYLGARAAGDALEPVSTPFLGLPVGQDELERAMANADAKRVDDPHACAVELLASGRVVAWMQGRAELGPRALGHRSILGDPRRREHVDRLNRIKGREAWRPVAPAIAEHAIERYCSTPAVNRSMGIAVPMSEAAHAEIPAGLHVDGSARVQKVTPADEHMHRLVSLFEHHVGVPCVLNTSLNGPGQPLIHRAADALELFRTTEIDALVVGNYLLAKAS
ncbi:carbamoyltransferase C-terminal domain-containing protein [Haliangium ochraceum]|uniref:Carbamoyltransferase n=1 Tax=Haliangium ochraceum (strain DSM 14365 / JCM 11303 / SMP-2) TaxID=502025 RepID=D0LTE0_HALO1|nr:carbamoyltransferase C-terminal domain-containing protein [Haliangium ochraceum]ACY13835.1 Carbamoyltransferase [Haliangium ochraceum DSM 14365]